MGAAGTNGGDADSPGAGRAARRRGGRSAATSAGGARGASAQSGIRLVALDLDGVVWRGDRVLPGVRAALEDVLERGLDLRYVSNNSTAHRETVSERLAGAGLPAGVERVLTSGFVTGRWLRARLPEGTSVMVLGEEGLLRELREAGIAAYHAGGARQAAENREAADGRRAGPAEGDPGAGLEPAAVVVGMDRSFTYQTLAAAQAAIVAGAVFVATNLDATFPTPSGLVPGSGAIVAAVSAAAQREPVLMGKPGLALAETLAAVTGVSPGQTLFVGDRLSTDIAMGRAAGMVTALVLTGVTSEDDLRRARAAEDVAGGARDAGRHGAEKSGETAAAMVALPDRVLAGLGELPRLVDELTQP